MLSDLSVSFIPPAAIHVTLLPPWEMINQSMIEEKIRIALRHTRRFSLHLEHLAFGPNAIKPRFIWILCSASEELIQLKKALLLAFHISDHVPFIPHLTLARLSQEDGKRLKKQPI
jgi:2'-5' RNA ligase